MFERPQAGNRCILVHLDFGRGRDTAACEELRELAHSAGAQICDLVLGHRRVPDARLYCGSGKAQEVADCVNAHGAELVIFNHDISPRQERNLEALFKCRVLDRTGLILDIFAQRARTHEGKLQVELAQLGYLSTRLVRGWSHLERQRGGIGLRGPGETQLEIDRRLLAVRERSLRARLEKVRSQRGQGRASRQKHGVPLVALVGYTNAGKSTLFNALTGAAVQAEDKLFATLDPTLRRLPMDLGEVVLADTVGFIRDLPHGLVEAFRATLEETRNAQLLLHVIDASDLQRHEHIEQVQAVLEEIRAADVPQIRVYNKQDLCAEPLFAAAADMRTEDNRVHVSALTGDGIDALLQLLKQRFFGQSVAQELCLPLSAGKLRAKLFRMGAVRAERHGEAGESILQLNLPPATLQRLLQETATGDLQPADQ